MEVAVVLAVLSLVVSVVAVIVGYVTARKYGDMAAVSATLKFQKEEAARARVAAFQSLINAVGRARKVVQYYDDPTVVGMPRMPIAPFEAAFVSGSPGLSASPELLDAVNDYLVVADCLNGFIDGYIARGGSGRESIVNTDLRQGGPSLSEVLGHLEDCLRRELEKAQLTIDELGS